MLRRILIKFDERIYRFLNFELSYSQGLFLVSFGRRGKRVTYHASGFIHYHNLTEKNIYGEPIFQITKPFGFISCSIPSVEKLDIYTKPPTEDDITFEIIGDPFSRINFDFIIAQWDYIFPNSPGLSIRYENLFSFNMLFNDKILSIPENLRDQFIFFSPVEGLLNQSAFDRETALLHFHQKVQGTQDLIIYSPNNEGEYTLIFSVPMRVSPKVKIEFEEADLQIEILKSSNTNIRFKVKNKYGHTVKTEKKIVGMELDARL